MATKYSFMKLDSESSDFMFDYCSAFEYRSFVNNDAACYRNEYQSAFTYRSLSCSGNFSDSRKDPWLSVVLRHTIFCVSCLIALLLFPISIIFCVKRLHSLERLVVSRLGKLQPVKGPGFVLVLPFVEHWTKVDLHPRDLTVSTSQVLTSDGGIVEVSANITYQVSDILHYVTKSSDPFKSLQDLSTYSLINIVAGSDQEDLEKNRESLSEALKMTLNETVTKWGVEVVSVSLSRVKILKAAEPVNAICTLMGALKAAAEQSSSNSVCANIVTEVPENLSAKKLDCLDREIVEEQSGVISVLQQFVTSAVDKEKVRNITVVIKLEIICATPKIVHFILCDGNITALKSTESKQNPDVSIVLSESSLQDILKGKINTLEAYMEGKIVIRGNRALLRTLI